MESKIISLVALTAILAIFAFSVISTPVGAQPVEVWNVTLSNSMGCALATAGNYVYLAGVNSAGTNAFINKYDSDGNLIWNITLGKQVDVLGSATAATDDYVYLLAGEVIEPHCDNYSYLNKYDKAGNLIWNITLGVPSQSSALATATTGDCVYVAVGGQGKNIFNKYDGDGNLIWNITRPRGGITYWATSIATGDSAVYLAGDTFLNKYNSTNGNLIWNITWGGIGTLGRATATSRDSVYLAGLSESSDFDFCNAFLNKYNGTDGSLIWNITWGKTGWVNGRAIATSGDNAVYLAGSKTNESVAPAYANESDAFLVKFSEPTPSPTPTPPGFEAGFAIVGLLAVAYLVLRRRK
nr:hypothetical membrane protein [uncultured archaeon]